MGKEKDGYLPPRDVIFKEIITKCRHYWTSKLNDKNQDYILEKLIFIKLLKNEGADVMFALAQFHPILRIQIIGALSDEAKDFVKYYEQVNENKGCNTEGDN
jgi:hypothetical protein